MIKHWKLRNFKSVEDSSLELSPLTIFAGANSSGKSTVIQSILLTAQTLQNPVYSRSIILNGHIVRLGTYSDVVSLGHKQEPIAVGFTLTPSNLVYNIASRNKHLSDDHISDEVECNFSFLSKDVEDEELHPRLVTSSIAVASLDKATETRLVDSITITRSNLNLKERIEKFKLPDETVESPDAIALTYEVKISDKSPFCDRMPSSWRPAGVSLKHFLPYKIAFVFDSVEMRADYLVALFSGDNGYFYDRLFFHRSNLLDTKIPKEFVNKVVELASNILVESGNNDVAVRRVIERLDNLDTSNSSLRKFDRLIHTEPAFGKLFLNRFRDLRSEFKDAAKSGLKPEYRLELLHGTSRAVEVGSDRVQDFFSKYVKYLGPLRDEPKHIYPIVGGLDPKDVGFRGENTAAVLELNKNIRIKYIPSSCFAKKNADYQEIEADLFAAVTDWLKYMGVAETLDTIDKGKLGHELKVNNFDLTHVGVGVSQVLPIVVLSLLASPESTLIFEQPELHLHPRVQSRLADFFISLIMMNKQCIVETHSEYLIEQLRYRVLISDSPSLAEQSVIYFVERPSKRSQFRKLCINEKGIIKDWPKGFFDESEQISAEILEAQLANRRKRR